MKCKNPDPSIGSKCKGEYKPLPGKKNFIECKCGHRLPASADVQVSTPQDTASVDSAAGKPKNKPTATA